MIDRGLALGGRLLFGRCPKFTAPLGRRGMKGCFLAWRMGRERAPEEYSTADKTGSINQIAIYLNTDPCPGPIIALSIVLVQTVREAQDMTGMVWRVDL
jgi:hypothetical protein